MPSNSYTIRLLKFLKSRKTLFVYVPMIIYWVLVSVANVLPPGSFSKYQFNDKAEHFIAYFVLTGFLCITNMVQNKIYLFRTHPFTPAFLFAALYGFLNEIIQLYVPGRSCDFKDWLADVSGAMFAVVLLYLVFIRAVRFLNINKVTAE
jgi:VanZ family protein